MDDSHLLNILTIPLWFNPGLCVKHTRMQMSESFISTLTIPDDPNSAPNDSNKVF